MITKREAAIISAYTGYIMLASDDIEIFYSYLYELFDRPIYTHELPGLEDEIHKRSKQDFIDLCKQSIYNEVNDYTKLGDSNYAE